MGKQSSSRREPSGGGQNPSAAVRATVSDDQPEEGAVEEEAPEVVEIALSEEQCKQLLDEIVRLGIVDWKHITSKILQSLQPPQTATHVPQLEGIRERYPSSRRWAPARRWMYAQYGPCPVCGSGMNLTHDHVLPRDLLADRADLLENLRFLCYRDNQSRHWEHGGALELGTAAACIYLLVTRKPRTLAELTKLGRRLKLTQSSQRFEETWALAVYLHLQGRYELDEIHPAIGEAELKKFSAYYRATNEYFDKLTEDLNRRYAALLPTIEGIQLLVTTRAVRPEDRTLAAKELGILAKPGVKASVEKKRITDQDRRIFLE